MSGEGECAVCDGEAEYVGESECVQEGGSVQHVSRRERVRECEGDINTHRSDG